jgi:DNA-directed RNA polymerase subunit RPC12/RpoP
MITTISTWRCRCGTRVKVIGQTPKDKPSATQYAACPTCGDKQIIYGETIVSVSTEHESKSTESK